MPCYTLAFLLVISLPSRAVYLLDLEHWVLGYLYLHMDHPTVVGFAFLLLIPLLALWSTGAGGFHKRSSFGTVIRLLHDFRIMTNIPFNNTVMPFPQ